MFFFAVASNRLNCVYTKKGRERGGGKKKYEIKQPDAILKFLIVWLTWRSSEDGPWEALSGLCKSSSFFAISWWLIGIGNRAICAAANAADDEGGRPARSAAEEAGIPGGSPKMYQI